MADALALVAKNVVEHAPISAPELDPKYRGDRGCDIDTTDFLQPNSALHMGSLRNENGMHEILVRQLAVSSFGAGTGRRYNDFALLNLATKRVTRKRAQHEVSLVGVCVRVRQAEVFKLLGTDDPINPFDACQFSPYHLSKFQALCLIENVDSRRGTRRDPSLALDNAASEVSFDQPLIVENRVRENLVFDWSETMIRHHEQS